MVFNSFSGNTHLLDIVSAEVLRHLETKPAGMQDICIRVAGFLEVDNDARLRMTVEDILLKLRDLTIVEAVPR